MFTSYERNQCCVYLQRAYLESSRASTLPRLAATEVVRSPIFCSSISSTTAWS